MWCAIGAGRDTGRVNIWLLVNLALVLNAVVVVILIVSEDREPTAALGWLTVLLALPYTGLLLYFLFGRNWPVITQRSPANQRMLESVDHFMPTVYEPHRDTIGSLPTRTQAWVARGAALIERKAATPPLPVRTCDVYGNGAEYFDALIADLEGAQRFIHMSYFIWKQDALTARITAVLHERLAAGVEVRILNDFVGCIHYPKDELKKLSEAGATVGSDMSQLSRINYRNHRKITVVDGEIGHTGGFNIGQEYIDGGKRFPAWRDTGLRMTGPGVADLEKLFDIRWLEVHGEDLFDPRYYPAPDLDAGEILVQTVHQGYDDPWNAVTRSYQLAISSAHDRVQLQSPYVVPDPSTLDALINAAASGVRVDLMTTKWLDKKLPWWAAESYFDKLLTAGVRIWQWEPGFFHAKSLTVDGEACAIGTLNLDIRSLRINKELMVWVYDRAVVAQHEQLFLDDLRSCSEVTLDEVRAWSPARRFRNSAARLLSNLL